jgi:hypothetical protein
MKDASSPWNSDELGRDLRTALDTTKWQVIHLSYNSQIQCTYEYFVRILSQVMTDAQTNIYSIYI